MENQTRRHRPFVPRNLGQQTFHHQRRWRKAETVFVLHRNRRRFNHLEERIRLREIPQGEPDCLPIWSDEVRKRFLRENVVSLNEYTSCGLRPLRLTSNLGYPANATRSDLAGPPESPFMGNSITYTYNIMDISIICKFRLFKLLPEAIPCLSNQAGS